MYTVCGKGLLSSNSYIYWNENDGADVSKGEKHEAAVIDAGCSPADIFPEAEKRNLKIKYIILTHAHIDHSYYLDSFLAEADGSVSVCHVSEESLFYDTVANVSEMIGAPKTFAAPDMKVSESDTLSVGGKRIEFIHTPGHTPGGMCIYVPEEKIMFTGDTLFCNGFGRTDLGGSARDLAESIKKLYTMDTDITILPGHGCSSTIGEESAWGIPSVLC